MQQMQDKEFDQLFRDKFEDALVEPSSNLWNNIEQELVVKRKRKFPVYWAAAAAVITAVSAALLLHEPEKIQLHADLSATTATIESREKGNVQDTQNPSVQQKESSVQIASVKTGHHTEVSPFENADLDVEEPVIATEASTNTVTNNSVKKDLLAMQPLAAVVHPDNKETGLKQTTTTPNTTLPIAKVLPEEEIMLASAETGKEIDESESRQTEGKRIRNVGDLVNYVVDKVDKREEKFIQFKTDDDDNSSIIALNIGMFRFNQKKHK